MSASRSATKMRRLVQDIHAVDGLIAAEAQGAERPVFPNRDKRKRPVIWIEQAGFIWLRGEGMIEPVSRGFVLVRSAVRRLDAARLTAEGQHAALESRDIYTPDQVVRPANINTRATALDRLARRRGSESNGRWLSAAELEAGHALARDWHRAGQGQMATQDFTSSGVQGGDRNGAAERAMLARITASTRLRTAQEILGKDMAPALIALCCRSERLEDIERSERWAAGSGKQIIKMGLTRLVGLYGTKAGSRSRSNAD